MAIELKKQKEREKKSDPDDRSVDDMRGKKRASTLLYDAQSDKTSKTRTCSGGDHTKRADQVRRKREKSRAVVFFSVN